MPTCKQKTNRIVQEQCSIHRIQERLDAIDKMTKYCGHPSPKWLEKMILTLYAQMTEIRRYAEKKCRKIHTPISEFSPTIRLWYNRIHVYLQLIRLKEGKTKKVRNVFKLARKHNILKMVELPVAKLKPSDKKTKEAYFDKSSAMISHLINKCRFSRYPHCKNIIYNNESEFKLHFETLCDKYRVKHKPTSIKNPQANAILEWIHQVLKWEWSVPLRSTWQIQ